MQKLDGKFYGEIRKAKDDSVVPDDEYVVFLAKDNAFAAMLPHYRAYCFAIGCGRPQLEAVDRLLERVGAWRYANLSRCKDPDVGESEKLLG